MLAVAVSVKLLIPTVIETGFGISCGTELAGAGGAGARVALGVCAARERGRRTARAPASTMSHERRQPRTLPAHRMDLVVFMNPTSRADWRTAETTAGRSDTGRPEPSAKGKKSSRHFAHLSIPAGAPILAAAAALTLSARSPRPWLLSCRQIKSARPGRPHDRDS